MTISKFPARLNSSQTLLTPSAQSPKRQHGPPHFDTFKSVPIEHILLLQIVNKGAQHFSTGTHGKTNAIAQILSVY
jgi:hypothetical protein